MSSFLAGALGGGSGSTAACRCRGQAAHGADGVRCDYDEEVGKCANAGAGNGGKSRDSVRVDNNQPKRGSEDVQNIT